MANTINHGLRLYSVRLPLLMRDVASIAGELGVRIAAVRQYLKRVFDKTGTHNQATLVVLLCGFTEPCR